MGRLGKVAKADTQQINLVHRCRPFDVLGRLITIGRGDHNSSPVPPFLKWANFLWRILNCRDAAVFNDAQVVKLDFRYRLICDFTR